MQAHSKEQRYLATSSAAAELCQLFLSAKKLHAMVAFMQELGLDRVSCSLLTDSQSSICSLEKPLQKRQKHIALYICYLKELQERYGLKILYIKRDLNLADMLTKQPPKKIFCQMLGWLRQPFVWRHVLLDNT